MKIIEALKHVKSLKKKIEDIQQKIYTYSADNDSQDPTYQNQKEQVSAWVQSCEDINKEISSLIHRIHKTNILTKIDIEVEPGTIVSKTIDEWLLRLNSLVDSDKKTWQSLNVDFINDVKTYNIPGTTKAVIVKRRLYFDPKKRDEKIALYISEATKIQSKLEIINATTDLVA